MAVTVALINMKGGVGKSTLTVNLAWYFALKENSRVLVVDLDPQFNASQYLLGQAEYTRMLRAGRPTIWDIFEQRTRTPQTPGIPVDPRRAVQNRATTRRGGRIDVIPSRLELAFSLKTPYQQKEQELAGALDSLTADYDFMLIDCAPTESILTTAAYLASDFLLVPVKPEYLSSVGLPLLDQSLGDFSSAHPGNTPTVAGVVFNATTDYSPEEYLAKQDVREVAAQHGWYVFEAEVTYSRSYPRGARLGLSIYQTPNSRRSQCRRFSEVADELKQRIGL